MLENIEAVWFKDAICKHFNWNRNGEMKQFSLAEI